MCPPDTVTSMNSLYIDEFHKLYIVYVRKRESVAQYSRWQNMSQKEREGSWKREVKNVMWIPIINLQINQFVSNKIQPNQKVKKQNYR